MGCVSRPVNRSYTMSTSLSTHLRKEYKEFVRSFSEWHSFWAGVQHRENMSRITSLHLSNILLLQNHGWFGRGLWSLQFWLLLSMIV